LDGSLQTSLVLDARSDEGLLSRKLTERSRIRPVVTHEVQLHYFAAARDLAGCAEERLSLPGPSVSVEELRALLARRHARLAPYLARMLLAVNDELHAAPALVHAGDAVSVLPPVAGGSAVAPSFVLRREPLSVDEAIAAVQHPGAGGISVFLGVVRDHAAQGAVARLEYEAHPVLAAREMERVLVALLEEFPGTRVCVQHRLGSLAVGDVAVVVAASAAHRADAFRACRAAIDRIKESVPIWKKEWAPDGSALWVNLEG
jgi:molybdopterin synthase catalytic subunit/molybdopterin converting factor small subunit